MNIKSCLMHDYAQIKKNNPLILNLTNHVVMNFNANLLLAIGASPIMSEDFREISELVRISDAVVINIGTLTESFEKMVSMALECAMQHNKPVVFDPVGAGASKVRTTLSQKIIEHDAVKIVRGNASEILNIFNLKTESRGVDNLATNVPIDALQTLLDNKNLTVIVSGKIDYVFNSKQCITIEHGSPHMTRVTGMGCSSTALVAAFAAVNPNPLKASQNAMTIMGLAGEKAQKKSFGPGSFYVSFLDEISNLQDADFNDLNISYLPSCI